MDNPSEDRSINAIVAAKLSSPPYLRRVRELSESSANIEALGAALANLVDEELGVLDLLVSDEVLLHALTSIDWSDVASMVDTTAKVSTEHDNAIVEVVIRVSSTAGVASHRDMLLNFNLAPASNDLPTLRSLARYFSKVVCGAHELLVRRQIDVTAMVATLNEETGSLLKHDRPEFWSLSPLAAFSEAKNVSFVRNAPAPVEQHGGLPAMSNGWRDGWYVIPRADSLGRPFPAKLEDVALVDDQLRARYTPLHAAEVRVASSMGEYLAAVQDAVDVTGRPSQLAVSLLSADIANHLSQSFLAMLRGQMQIGWASLRISAEAAKDLDLIIANPGLYAAWLDQALAGRRGEAASNKSQKRFIDQRKKYAWTENGLSLRTIMKFCSTYGSHAGSYSMVVLAPRVPVAFGQRQDRDAVLGHSLELLSLHAMTVGEILEDTLADYLVEEAMPRVRETRAAFAADMMSCWPAMDLGSFHRDG